MTLACPAGAEIPVTKKTSTAPDFEAALAELEQIVARLEQGELSLEQSLRQFERGVELSDASGTDGARVTLRR